MPLLKLQLDNILAKLDSYASSPADLIITLLGSADYIDHDAVHDIHRKTDKILESLAQNPGISTEVIHWAHQTTMRIYADQMHTLVGDKAGLRFNARNCTAQSLKDFDILGLAERIKVTAPYLWELLGVLLAADSGANVFREYHRKQRQEKKITCPRNMANHDGDVVMTDGDDSEAEYWRGQDDPVVEEEHDEDYNMDEAIKRWEALMTIVSRDNRIQVVVRLP
jgi:hypothetical protein